MDNDIDKLAAALVAFQAEIPEVKKTKTARAGSFSYTYADLGDIWAAIRKPLSDSKLAVVQVLNGGREGHTQLTTIIMHESGQKLESVLDLPTAEKTPQEAGSLFTYYKRYALSAALGISTEEDDDGKAGNKAPAKTTPAASPNKDMSSKQAGLIKSLAKDAGYSDEKIAARLMEINSSAEASDAIAKLQALKDEGPGEREWKQ
jgi:hypothetical protein